MKGLVHHRPQARKTLIVNFDLHVCFMYSTQKAEHSLKKAELVSQEREDLGFSHQDPQRRLQILMALGRVNVKAHKTGHALEAFEKVISTKTFFNE